MTTNTVRTADLIYSHMSSWDDESQAVNATQALADAGLLMPDLPRPMQIIDSDWAKFNEHIEAIDGAVQVYFAGDFGESPENLTPEEAREHALALLAAANHAEQGQP